MRPTCGPFNQFGPHADQIRSCGPLWKHCLFHPPSAFRKLIRFSIGESIYILYIFQRAQQTLGDINKMIFDGPSIRNTWQKNTDILPSVWTMGVAFLLLTNQVFPTLHISCTTPWPAECTWVQVMKKKQTWYYNLLVAVSLEEPSDLWHQGIIGVGVAQ